jgi:hypothetical protein
MTGKRPPQEHDERPFTEGLDDSAALSDFRI